MPVAAQTAPPGARDPDIIVTASKSGATRLDDLAAAISVVDGATLDAVGAQDIRDVAPLIPGLQVTQTVSFGQIYIRGIGSNNVYGGSEPSATMQLDGVYLARPVSMLASFVDVARIEVLRGPQATLYGRNAIAGTINIVSRPPGDTLEAEARVGVGAYGGISGEARLSGPLGGGTAGSLAVMASRHDGYLANVVPGVGDLDSDRTLAARAQLRFAPVAGTESILRADYTRSDSVPAGNAKLLGRTGDPLTDSVLGDYRRVAVNFPASAGVTGWGVALDSGAALGTARLRLITAYRESRLAQWGDSDASALDLRRTQQKEAQHQFSQEATLSGRRGALEWLAGAYYFREHIAVDAALTRVGIDRARYAPLIETQAWAGYVSGTYAVLPSVSLTAGVRYSREVKRFDQDAQVASSTGVLLPGYPLRYARRGDYGAWSPSVGFQFRPAARVLLYLSAARGFKSGGFNFASLDPAQGFAPEQLWSYEAGAKLGLLPGLHLDASAFHYDYRDLQVQSYLAPGLVAIGNAASADVDGVELDARASPLGWLRFGASLTWLDARYRSYPAFPTAAGPFDASGKRLSLAPEWTAQGYGEVRVPLGAGTLSARGEASWRSRQFFTPVNGGLEQQRGYALIDASLGYGFHGDRLRVSAFVRNLADTGYVTSTASYTAGIAGHAGPPRTIGLRLAWKAS